MSGVNGCVLISELALNHSWDEVDGWPSSNPRWWTVSSVCVAGNMIKVSSPPIPATTDSLCLRLNAELTRPKVYRCDMVSIEVTWLSDWMN